MCIQIIFIFSYKNRRWLRTILCCLGLLPLRNLKITIRELVPPSNNSIVMLIISKITNIHSLVRSNTMSPKVHRCLLNQPLMITSLLKMYPTLVNCINLIGSVQIDMSSDFMDILKKKLSKAIQKIIVTEKLKFSSISKIIQFS